MTNSGKRVAVVLARNFEDIEATSPIEALEAAGSTITVIGTETGPIEGKKGAVIHATHTFGDVSPEDFDLLVIPGGGAPENLRINEDAVAWTKAFTDSGRPVGAICHGAQLLISARVLAGRKLTAVNKIRDDVANAGGTWLDEPLVIDGNLITSRVPGDLPQFNEALVKAIAS